jgi:hypothetical protein
VTYPQIGAFARLANGNAPKTRSIAGQPTKLGRDAHDVFYDEVNDELVVAGAFAQSILTYRGGANGEEPPIRVIQGPKTQIQMPGYGVYVDAVHNETFLVEGRDRPGEEYILVFPRNASGDVAPIRVIKGPDTMLKNARSMAVDPVRNLIAVTSNNGLLIFNRTDNGNVKPRAIIKGPGGNFRLLESKGYIVSAGGGGGGGGGDDDDGGRGGASARGAGGGARGGGGNAGARGAGGGSIIRVWSITDNGNVPPLFELRNPNGGPGGGGNRVALNPKEKEVILGGAGTPESVEIYSFPEIFD